VPDPLHRLLVLRHAKSDWTGGFVDHERPLAKRGRRDAPAVGRWLRDRRLTPDLVLCSTARRAQETWELVESELGDGSAATRFDDRVYGASADELAALAAETPEGVRTLLIVGHNPAIQQLALTLPGSADDAAKERARDGFGTATLAVLDVPEPWQGLRFGGSARLIEVHRPRER
jgi:phosphohistidine phosphatase